MAKKQKTEIPADVSTRMLCDILEDMRKAYKTRNFSYLPGLIEELQYRAWRMENALDRMGGWDGVRSLEDRRKQLKQDVRELEEKLHGLQQEETDESSD